MENQNVTAQDATQSKTKPKAISLARGTAVISVLTLLSRVLGFIRDLVIARGFGSSVFSDCFFVAFRIPNLLRSFVAEGALSSAFVPVFADSLHKGDQHAHQTIKRVSGFIFIITSILSCLGIIFTPQIISAFAPGFKDDPGMMSLCIELTRYMFPIVLCVSLVAMLNGALNTLGNFGAAAWSQVWMNLVLIAGAIFALWQDKPDGIRLLAISALLGSILQIIVQLPALRRFNLSILPSFSLFNPEIKKLLKLMIPAIIGATVYQLGIFLNTMLASLLAPGSVSWLYYADRLVQFPLGTFSIALGSVLLPALSISHSSGDSANFDKKTFAALRYTSFFIFPVAAFVFILAEPLTMILFQRGSFSAQDTAMTAAAVQMYALGIWSVSSHSLFARSFIARKDTVTNTLVGIGSLVINFLVSLLVIGPLQPQNGISSAIASIQSAIVHCLHGFNMGHKGLGLASTCGSIFSLVMLAFLSRNILKSGWKDYIVTTLKSLVASAALIIALFLLPDLSNHNFYLILLGKIILGCTVWLCCMLILKSAELKEIYLIAKQKFKK